METTELNRILWLDVETTGLLPDKDVILEVGVRITDIEGNNIDEVTSIVWDQDWSWKLARNEAVFNMHAASGLVDELNDLTKRSDRDMYNAYMVSAGMHKWIAERLGEDNLGVLPMAGNSVHYDRSFVAVHMPKLLTAWHYRNLDMSSSREACRLTAPRLFATMPKPIKVHRPQADIDESIKLWRWLNANFFYTE